MEEPYMISVTIQIANVSICPYTLLFFKERKQLLASSEASEINSSKSESII
jgi:hypothetical protein